jgi:DNA-binding transcriptional regulator YiaG
MPELTEADFKRAIRHSVRRRLMKGVVESGKDIADLRRYLGMTQEEFATAAKISVWTLRGWEQDRRHPEGPALALLRDRSAAPADLSRSPHGVLGVGRRAPVRKRTRGSRRPCRS